MRFSMTSGRPLNSTESGDRVRDGSLMKSLMYASYKGGFANWQIAVSSTAQDAHPAAAPCLIYPSSVLYSCLPS